MATPRICSIPDCGKTHYAHGWCSAHWQRWRRHGDPLGGSTPRGDMPGSPARFYREVVLTYDGTDCLIWPYSRNPEGYGQMRLDGRLVIVSRRVCSDVNGPPPTPEHEAAHNCGKGHLACVTKGHLSWKTTVENEADRVIHGTIPRGEQCSFAQVSEAEVRQMRALKGTMTIRAIAEMFEHNEWTVYDIMSRRTWAWLE